MRRCLASLVALSVMLVAAPCSYAAEPVSIAVIDLDYRDTSGEPTDQAQAHTERLKLFMDALRADLATTGDFKVVELECDAMPCSIERSDTESLLNAAKAAGATLMLYGGIQKASTLIQFANVVISDVERNEVVVQRSLSFRGDDERSWQRAEKFAAKQLNEGLAAWRTK